jgi:hypothetical protein
MLHAVGCVLHRSTSRVIHCSEIFQYFSQTCPLQTSVYIQSLANPHKKELIVTQRVDQAQQPLIPTHLYIGMMIHARQQSQSLLIQHGAPGLPTVNHVSQQKHYERDFNPDFEKTWEKHAHQQSQSLLIQHGAPGLPTVNHVSQQKESERDFNPDFEKTWEKH